MYTDIASRKDYFYLLIYAVALAISFSQQGIDAPVFNGRFFWLGKYSFSLYLSHQFYALNLNTLLPDLSIQHLQIAYYACAAVTALVIMLLSDLLRSLAGKLKPHILVRS